MRSETSASRSPADLRRAYVAWVAICVIWGTTYLAIKVALDSVPPFLMGGLRYLLAGGLLAGWQIARGSRMPARASWPSFAALGALMLGLGNGGVVVAEQWVPSGLAAVVIATTPFWMVGVEAMLPGGERLRATHALGLAIGFLGILVLVGPEIARGTGGGWRVAAGFLALQISCAGWSVGSAYGRRRTGHVAPVPAAALQMLFGGALMLAAGTLLGEWPRLRVTPAGAGAVLYLALAGALAGFVAYLYALRHLPVSFVSLYAYVNPVIAVALGTLLLGEPFHLRMAAGAVAVLAGMAVVSAARSRPAPAAPRSDDGR